MKPINKTLWICRQSLLNRRISLDIILNTFANMRYELSSVWVTCQYVHHSPLERVLRIDVLSSQSIELLGRTSMVPPKLAASSCRRSSQILESNGSTIVCLPIIHDVEYDGHPWWWFVWWSSIPPRWHFAVPKPRTKAFSLGERIIIPLSMHLTLRYSWCNQSTHQTSEGWNIARRRRSVQLEQGMCT